MVKIVRELPRTERRYIASEVKIEKRSDGGEGDSRKITGYAAVFNKPSVPIWGWFRERIQKGAFTKVLASNPDVRALFNHCPDNILARTKSGTLEIWEDEIGLGFRFEAPNSPVGDSVLEAIRRGDVDQCSFQFTIDPETGQQWAPVAGDTTDDDVKEERLIIEVESLIDVGPVTFPAYPDTSAEVAKRSQSEWERFTKNDEGLSTVEQDHLEIQLQMERVR